MTKICANPECGKEFIDDSKNQITLYCCLKCRYRTNYLREKARRRVIRESMKKICANPDCRKAFVDYTSRQNQKYCCESCRIYTQNLNQKALRAQAHEKKGYFPPGLESIAADVRRLREKYPRLSYGKAKVKEDEER